MYFFFSLLSWILLHDCSNWLRFACHQFCNRHFESHSTQNPLRSKFKKNYKGAIFLLKLAWVHYAYAIVCKTNSYNPLACMRIKRIIATKLLVSGIELLNFRSKFLGLVPENLHTKILTNSNWLRYFLFSLVLFLFSFIAKKKKEMNKSKTNSMITGINICF